MAIKKATTTEPENGAAENTESKFSKDQLIASKRFQGRRDALQAVLQEGKRYTINQAQAAIDDFMRKKV